MYLQRLKENNRIPHSAQSNIFSEFVIYLIGVRKNPNRTIHAPGVMRRKQGHTSKSGKTVLSPGRWFGEKQKLITDILALSPGLSPTKAEGLADKAMRKKYRPE